MALTLVDSSSWIEFLRAANHSETRQRVGALVLADQACWCEIIRLELWNGAGQEEQKGLIRRLEVELPSLSIDAEVWQLSIELAKRARAKSLTAPTADLVIAACAYRHGVGLEHNDRHLTALQALLP